MKEMLLTSSEMLLCLDAFLFLQETMKRKIPTQQTQSLSLLKKLAKQRLTKFETQFQNISIVTLFSGPAYYKSMLKSKTG